MPPIPMRRNSFSNGFTAKRDRGSTPKKNMAISVRKDVAQDYLPADARYIEGTPVLMGDAEDFGVEENKKLAALMREIFQEGK